MSAPTVEKQRAKALTGPCAAAQQDHGRALRGRHRLHTEVFGPKNGYRSCWPTASPALQAWHEQINDLPRLPGDRFRPPRPRPQQECPRPRPTASTTCRRPRCGARRGAASRRAGGRRRPLHGRHRDQRLVGPVPSQRREARGRRRTDQHHARQPARQDPVAAGPRNAARDAAAAARNMIRSLGGAPLVRGTQPGSFRFLQMMAVGAGGRSGDRPSPARHLRGHPPSGRGSWARVLVDELGPRTHIDLSGLTVPALVIGSTKDRLPPMCRARKIAGAVPESSTRWRFPAATARCSNIRRSSTATCAAWSAP